MNKRLKKLCLEKIENLLEEGYEEIKIDIFKYGLIIRSTKEIPKIKNDKK